jgi:hypothetical protein
MTATQWPVFPTFLRSSHPEHSYMLVWSFLYFHSWCELCIGDVALADLLSQMDQPESLAVYLLQLWNGVVIKKHTIQEIIKNT